MGLDDSSVLTLGAGTFFDVAVLLSYSLAVLLDEAISVEACVASVACSIFYQF